MILGSFTLHQGKKSWQSRTHATSLTAAQGCPLPELHWSMRLAMVQELYITPGKITLCKYRVYSILSIQDVNITYPGVNIPSWLWIFSGQQKRRLFVSESALVKVLTGSNLDGLVMNTWSMSPLTKWNYLIITPANRQVDIFPLSLPFFCKWSLKSQPPLCASTSGWSFSLLLKIAHRPKMTKPLQS